MKTETAGANIALTERDMALLQSLHKFRYLSPVQIERLHFASSQTAVRRLRLLAGAGYVSLVRSRGGSERLAALSRGGAEVVADRLGVPLEAIDWAERRQTPSDYLFVQHFLAITDFRISLMRACEAARSDAITCLGFIPEYVVAPSSKGVMERFIRGVVADVQAPSRKVAHTPDAVFALERSGKAALFFLEVDRGTEVLGNPDRGVLKAVRFYLNLLNSSSYQRYAQEFGLQAPFKAFRALLVLPTMARLQNVRSICGSVTFEPARAKQFIWLTTAEAVLDEEILQRRWKSLDPSDPREYVIAG